MLTLRWYDDEAMGFLRALGTARRLLRRKDLDVLKILYINRGGVFSPARGLPR